MDDQALVSIVVNWGWSNLIRYCRVFQAEIFAIMCGTQAALKQRLFGRIFDFCSDRQSAIKALSSADSRSKLVIACRNQIEEPCIRVPMHSGSAPM